MPYRKIKNKKKEKSEYRKGKRSRQVGKYAFTPKAINVYFASSKGARGCCQRKARRASKGIGIGQAEARTRACQEQVSLAGQARGKAQAVSRARQARAEASGQGRESAGKRTRKGHAQGRLFGQGRRRRGQDRRRQGRHGGKPGGVLYGGVLFYMVA